MGEVGFTFAGAFKLSPWAVASSFRSVVQAVNNMPLDTRRILYPRVCRGVRVVCLHRGAWR